jgi:transcriptional regulator with XRE-family HTH domain
MLHPNNVKKVRLQKGFTQEMVADKIHLGLRAYQKIENGETKLDIERLQQLATVFNVGLLDLVKTGDTVNIENINTNVGGISNNEVTINQNYSPEDIKATYQLVIQSKDDEILMLKEELIFLKNLVLKNNLA